MGNDNEFYESIMKLKLEAEELEDENAKLRSEVVSQRITTYVFMFISIILAIPLVLGVVGS